MPLRDFGGQRKEMKEMKTRHLLLLFLAVLSPLFAHAQEEVTVGEIKYKLYSVGAYVSGTTTKNIVVASIAQSITDGTNNYNVIGIEDDAFSGCSGLLIASIPSTVTIIGERAFMNCGSLTAITVPGSVTTIGASAFYGCGKLNSLTLSSGIQSIGVDAFNGCQKLKTVTLPKTVVAVGHRAFAGCTELNKITIPEGLLSLGDDVFSGCESLTAISLPKSLINMGRGILQGCKSMTSVVVNAGNPVFDSRNGSNAIFRTATNELISGCKTTKIPATTNVICEYAFANIDGLTTATIGNSVTSIGEYAFYQCTGLASISMGNSVTSIGEYAFYGCTKLQKIILPNGVKEIKNSTFESSGLTSVAIGNSVTVIGSRTFVYCSNLKEVICYNTAPPSVVIDRYYASDNTFYGNADGRILYVPTESMNAYQSSGWGRFGFTIRSLDELPTGIEAVEHEKAGGGRSADDAWYTLGGQRLQGEPTTKGIYIQSGRKVLVK